jgi:hypothetical protein
MRLADRLVSAILEVRGVEEAPSQFSAVPALWIDGREFVNLHPGIVHIRLTRKTISAMRAALKQDSRIDLRSTDWITVQLGSAKDLAVVLDLARAAAEANRARRGERARASPTDRELARRRRTHRGSTEDLET